MSGWLAIASIIASVIGGHFGVTFLQTRGEIRKLQMKMQKENDDKIEAKLREHIDYMHKMQKESDERFNALYQQYIEMQRESIKRDAELQGERAKAFTAIEELKIIKAEYHNMKEEKEREIEIAHREINDLRATIDSLRTEQKSLLSRINRLERNQPTKL